MLEGGCGSRLGYPHGSLTRVYYGFFLECWIYHSFVSRLH